MGEKKNRARAIILKGDSLVTMYREFDDRKFYTFPGGVEENETLEECVVREVLEEFGIKIKPVKKLYKYSGMGSVEYFYLCEWISGNINELKNFSKECTGGKYVPTMIKIRDIRNLPLMPQEVAKSVYNDFLDNMYR